MHFKLIEGFISFNIHWKRTNAKVSSPRYVTGVLLSLLLPVLFNRFVSIYYFFGIRYLSRRKGEKATWNRIRRRQTRIPMSSSYWHTRLSSVRNPSRKEILLPRVSVYYSLQICKTVEVFLFLCITVSTVAIQIRFPNVHFHYCLRFTQRFNS